MILDGERYMLMIGFEQLTPNNYPSPVRDNDVVASQ
jgi:hypothetical protein